MENFSLVVDKKTDVIVKIKNLLKDTTFSKGELVLHNSFSTLMTFKIISISLPTSGPKIILLENSKIKFRFLANPFDLKKINQN